MGKSTRTLPPPPEDWDLEKQLQHPCRYAWTPEMKAYCDRNIDRWLEEEARKKPTVEQMPVSLNQKPARSTWFAENFLPPLKGRLDGKEKTGSTNSSESHQPGSHKSTLHQEQPTPHSTSSDITQPNFPQGASAPRDASGVAGGAATGAPVPLQRPLPEHKTQDSSPATAAVADTARLSSLTFKDGEDKQTSNAEQPQDSQHSRAVKHTNAKRREAAASLYLLAQFDRESTCDSSRSGA